jgi:hypothetical protein
MPIKLRRKERHNIILLILIFTYVFILSPFPPGESRRIAYSITLSGIFIIAVFAIKKKSNLYFYLSGIAIFLEWISDFYNLTALQWLASGFALLFFTVAIVAMMIRIAKSKRTGALEFLEAINIYFLLGILGSVFFSIIHLYSQGAFRFPEGVIPNRSDFIYYSFVTISTLGYGDIIPVSPLAKNFSIFISISGQLYLAMVVAMLVGKYLSKRTK